MKTLITFILIIISASSLAQQSIECQIMRQRIMERVNAPNHCQAMYQQCLANARYAPDLNFASAACGLQSSGCQMGGAIANGLGAEQQLQQEIQQYKSICEKN